MHRSQKLIFGALALLGLSATAVQASQSTPLVEADWIAQNLGNDNVILVDLRKTEDYDLGHIPGALNATYGKFGWRETVDGVVGMLPPLANINAKIGSLGITPDKHVIVIPYGKTSRDIGAAARAYWTFKVLGHDNVSLLDGGMNAWEKSGQALTTKASVASTAPPYPGFINNDLIIDTATLLNHISNETVLPIDSRINEQWSGEIKHPKARIPGVLPNAKRLPEAELIDPETGKFVPAGEVVAVAEAYGWSPDSSLPIVSYCNTGHLATTAWFALSEVAGVSDVVLYDGSMVAWTSNEENPVINSPNRLLQLVNKVTGSS